jgi:hypothetical protein
MPLYENATVGNADALHQQLSFRYNSVNESSSSDSGCLCGCQNPTPIPFYLVVNGDWKYNCIIHGHKGGLSKDFCILCNITTKTRYLQINHAIYIYFIYFIFFFYFFFKLFITDFFLIFFIYSVFFFISFYFFLFLFYFSFIYYIFNYFFVL